MALPTWFEREAVSGVEPGGIPAGTRIYDPGITGGRISYPGVPSVAPAPLSPIQERLAVLAGPVPPPEAGQLTAAVSPLGVIPAVAGALGITLPTAIAGALGVAGAAYAGYQALGGGEGEGLFGLNVLGGDGFALGGLEFGGPGLAEPTAPYREWSVGNKQFYYVPQYSPMTGKFLRAKVAMYNRDTKRWKVWTLPRPHLAVIGKNHPSHRMLTRLRHNLRRHTADAKTILQVSSPAYYAKMSGYHKHRGRR